MSRVGRVSGSGARRGSGVSFESSGLLSVFAEEFALLELLGSALAGELPDALAAEFVVELTWGAFSSGVSPVVQPLGKLALTAPDATCTPA